MSVDCNDKFLDNQNLISQNFNEQGIENREENL